MKKVCLILFSLLPFLTGCRDYKRINPENLENIYYDMFITDQMILNRNEFREAADTSAVYLTIFKQYGYTAEDFTRTIDYYLTKPDKFKKILTNVKARLEEKEHYHFEKNEKTIRERDISPD